MGAYGACEAVVQAIEKHVHHSEEVAKYAVNALGSLAYKDEGNQSRILAANGNYHIVQILTMYSAHPDIVENACRAVFHLCAEEVNNVSELGKHGVCGLVVTALQTHASNPTVITQCLLAISALAVKVSLFRGVITGILALACSLFFYDPHS